MPSPSNATPLPLRCVASHCLCVALRVAIPCLCVALRCFAHAMLCIAAAWLSLSLHCNTRASPITAVAVPIIAVTTLCVASPARCHPLPSPCFSPLSRRCALPRKATAFRRSAPPSLICAHPRPCAALRCPALPSLFSAYPRPCASLRRVGLPTLSWSILRLTARRLAMLRPRLAFPYDSRVAPAFLVNPSPGQRFASLRLCVTPARQTNLCPCISVLNVPLPMPSHAKQRQRISSLRLALPVRHLRSKLVYTAPRMSPASASAPVPRNFA